MKIEQFLPVLPAGSSFEDYVSTYALGWLIVVSVVSILACVYDKIISKADCAGLRVPEKTLMALSVLGGSLAMYITMQIVHHKTKHKKFMIGIPIIIVLQIILVIFYFYYILK